MTSVWHTKNTIQGQYINARITYPCLVFSLCFFTIVNLISVRIVCFYTHTWIYFPSFLYSRFYINIYISVYVWVEVAKYMQNEECFFHPIDPCHMLSVISISSCQFFMQYIDSTVWNTILQVSKAKQKKLLGTV